MNVILLVIILFVAPLIIYNVLKMGKVKEKEKRSQEEKNRKASEKMLRPEQKLHEEEKKRWEDEYWKRQQSRD